MNEFEKIYSLIESQQARILALEMQVARLNNMAKSKIEPSVSKANVNAVVAATCAVFEITEYDFWDNADYQGKPFVEARRHCYFILKDHYGMSYKEIGRQFGKDHSTVISSFNTCNARIERGRTYKWTHGRILDMLTKKSA